MHRVETLVVGAGQAGLAVSRCLAGQGADHVVIERGRIAERWRTARWGSLRLITPNWMSRLPGWSYPGTDPDGYMAAPELVSYLEDYAGSFAAPVHQNTAVELVEACGSGLRVVTDQRTWLASNVIVATGTENRPYVPPFASAIDPGVRQLIAGHYQGPHQVPCGGVLVVGASASGVQIADELRRSGRPVTIAVGRHSRIPRRYRGRDILWWMERAGILGHTIDQAHDARSARSAPSLQLTGRSDHPVGLDALAARGVTLAGRLVAADGRRLSFAGDLPASINAAQGRMERMLRTIDAYIERSVGDQGTGPADPPPPPMAAGGPASLDLRRAGIRTIVWATGYRPSYPWLRAPVLDRHGQIAHRRGVTSVPGLYVLGLKFLHRRDSTYVDGVRHDARFIAAHVTRRMTARAIPAGLPDTCGRCA
jgi:putative flavoprotein involved in K+ transport